MVVCGFTGTGPLGLFAAAMLLPLLEFYRRRAISKPLPLNLNPEQNNPRHPRPYRIVFR